MTALDFEKLAEMPEFENVDRNTLERLAELANDANAQNLEAANRQHETFKDGVRAAIPFIRKAGGEHSDAMLSGLLFAGIDDVNTQFRQVKNDLTGGYQWRDSEGNLPYIEGGEIPTTSALAKREFEKLLVFGNGQPDGNRQQQVAGSPPKTGGTVDVTKAKSRIEFNDMVVADLKAHGITTSTRGYNDHAQRYIKENKAFYESLPIGEVGMPKVGDPVMVLDTDEASEDLEKSLNELRQLKTDKTIPYVRDIRMLDLSEEAPPA